LEACGVQVGDSTVEEDFVPDVAERTHAQAAAARCQVATTIRKFLGTEQPNEWEDEDEEEDEDDEEDVVQPDDADALAQTFCTCRGCKKNTRVPCCPVSLNLHIMH